MEYYTDVKLGVRKLCMNIQCLQRNITEMYRAMC